MRSMPRAPIEAYGRTAAAESEAMPRSVRMRLTAAARSGAVSASVPSKSNSTARLVTNAAQEVVHVAIAPETVLPGKRVVGHADQLGRAQAGFAAPRGQLRGPDQALVVVRTAGQQA